MTLLSWVIQTYPGKDLMSDPSLRIPSDKVKPVLDQNTIDGLQTEYLEVTMQHSSYFKSATRCNRRLFSSEHA